MGTLQDGLARQFEGTDWGSVKGLHNFAYIPDDKLERLKATILDEDWGKACFVLEKYLAVNIRLAAEQGRFTGDDNRVVFAAGRLQTRYGAPVYLVFERNSRDLPPWYFKWVGDQTIVRGVPVLPDPPDLGEWPELRLGREVTVAHEHILKEHQERVTFLAQTPPVSQICAIAGAIQWAIHRGLQVKQLHRQYRQYFVPVYLQSRENLGTAPDLVAPIEVGADRLIVRTLLLPHMAYSLARSVVERVDRLPPWILAAWHGRPQDADAAALPDEINSLEPVPAQSQTDG
jgi:hypothetical protein